MVVRAEVGNRAHIGVFVDGLRGAGVLFVSHIVDTAGLVLFAVGIDHRHVVSLVGETFFLERWSFLLQQWQMMFGFLALL